MNTGQPQPLPPESNDPKTGDQDSVQDESSREELLDSLLDQTKKAVQDEGYHSLLTTYVREHRLSSKFDFENLSEMVRCIVNQTRIDQFPIDKEEAISWIANCFYEDPVACERVESLWNSIVSRMHDHD